MSKNLLLLALLLSLSGCGGSDSSSGGEPVNSEGPEGNEGSVKGDQITEPTLVPTRSDSISLQCDNADFPGPV
ncbi:MAG: hypothetical protein R3208_21665, partial [Ketobacteraceae bacterium]|nr:hypothetical protein [Ketobacteraceae bacterium]